MIASVVAQLKPDSAAITSILKSAREIAGVEIGELVQHRLPITIEADSSCLLESRTRQIQDIDGVSFVDVVFVSFDEVEHDGTELPSSTNNQST